MNFDRFAVSFYFNPRSLTGATGCSVPKSICKGISIHAPSRERPELLSNSAFISCYFNPRSLTGATLVFALFKAINADFNPRSLTGATASKQITSLFI